MNLVHLLREQFRPILKGYVSDEVKLEDYLGMIKPAQNPEHGDYQANFAMPLAKVLSKKPPEIAKEIVSKLSAGELLELPTVAGPGFINLRFRSDWLAKQIQKTTSDERLGVEEAKTKKTFVIDYSSPNIAKPLHVGHLRSTIIGEALCRIQRFLGHTVIADNHLGDWGTQFGMLLFGYKQLLNQKAFQEKLLNQEENKEKIVDELASLYVEVRKLAETFGMLKLVYEKYRDKEQFEKDPIGELSRLYLKTLQRKRTKSDKEDDEEDDGGSNPIIDSYRLETSKLHAGDEENLKLWKSFMPYCLEEINRVYKRLDINFDVQLGESFFQPMLAEVVDSMLQKKIAQESHGAVVIPNAKGIIPQTEEELKKEEPPGLIRKKDGAFTYTTTDLATIQYRIKEYQPNEILYVVDFRQELHFKTVFAQAHRWGYDKVKLAHVKFGSVLGKDNKPLSTRKGGGIELNELLDEAIREGSRKYLETRIDRYERGEEVPILTSEEKSEIAEVVGLGAVKYADLSQNRETDYKFDYDKMLATDGNTATYMQYAYVRCRGIFRKGDEDENRFRTTPPPVQLGTNQERNLALQILRFSESMDTAATEYKPHHLTGYLWDLAKTYSSFFVNCPVLKAETSDLRDSRLVLCDLTSRIIQKTLNLLGIRTVERM